MKKRLLFINNMAAPYQVKFCYALQDYFDTEMWFYTHLEANRPKWWSIPLGDKCRVLDGSRFIPILNYSNPNLLKEVRRFKPDIIIAGGFFFPSQYRVKNWAVKNNVKYITLGERVSYAGYQGISLFLKKRLKRLSAFLYRDIDLFLAMGEKPRQQMIGDLNFPKEKVVLARYPQDIDVNLKHELRTTKTDPVIIFPNRLDQSYNPLFALEVFRLFNNKYPKSTLKMNAMGELKEQCLQFIQDNKLNDQISFLDDIQSWDDLPGIYKQADIALFTATDSNGPNSLIECMASGTGVVLSKNINNTGEYAHHKENCFLSDLVTDDFVNFLSLYITEKGLLEKHGKLAQQAVKNRSTKETAKFYYQIISKLYN